MYIRECTTIPDFRLGFDLMSLSFVKLKANTRSEDMEMMRRARKLSFVLGESGRTKP